jgi:hypothetical protein
MTKLGEHLLGRVEPPDRVHEVKHPLRAAAAPPLGVEVTLNAPVLSDYDQGNSPRCVGYSVSRVMNWFNKYAFDANWLYDECKKIDPWPRTDGTSARYACDVLRKIGHWRMIHGEPVRVGAKLSHGIQANTWATSVDEIRSVFASTKPQPVLIGVEWMSDWFSPELRAGEYWLQELSDDSDSVGGHEIGIWACSDQRQAFGLRNTWGDSWPALAWVSYATMATLFHWGADACVLRDLPSR